MELGSWQVMSNVGHNIILSNHGTCVGGLKKVLQKLVEVLSHNGV